jgi:integrase
MRRGELAGLRWGYWNRTTHSISSRWRPTPVSRGRSRRHPLDNFGADNYVNALWIGTYASDAVREIGSR